MSRPRRAPEATPPDRDPRGARGRRGEELAAAFLSAHGYRCEQRNLRTRFGEIDLLARRRRLWIAVEVKTRTAHPAPEQLVDAAMLARLERALTKLAPLLSPRPRLLRIDVVAVRLLDAAEHEIRHFPGQPFAAPYPR